jgi:hypothetical protein
MVPQNAAPAKAPPTKTTPPVKKPLTEKSAEKATRGVVAASKTPAIIPVVALIAQTEPKAPLPMPIVPEAIEIAGAGAGPILMPPQNCPRQLARAKPNPPAGEALSLRTADGKPVDQQTESSPATAPGNEPAMSKRVEQHLLNNLQL